MCQLQLGSIIASMIRTREKTKEKEDSICEEEDFGKSNPQPNIKNNEGHIDRGAQRVNFDSKGFSKGFFIIEIKTKGFSSGFLS